MLTRPTETLAVLVALIVVTTTTHASQETVSPPDPAEHMILDLPAWDSNPANLPRELRPLEVLRPTLSPTAKAEVADLKERIAQLEIQASSNPDVGAQEAALHEAISLAERVLVLLGDVDSSRIEVKFWGERESEWVESFELTDVRQKLFDLRRLLAMGSAARAELFEIAQLDAESERLLANGKLDEAGKINDRQFEVRGRLLGVDHPLALESINNKAVVLWYQGRVDEAEPLVLQALEGRKACFGENHPTTLVSVMTLAMLLDARGRPEDAEPHALSALAGLRIAMGDEDPSTIASVNNVGFLLRGQGELAAAEPYMRHSVELGRRVLGDSHQDTLAWVINLGGFLEEQGELIEAEQCYRAALRVQRQVLDPLHPQQIAVLNNLGALLVGTGRLAEAEPYYRSALDQSRVVMGETHPRTMTSMNNLGLLLHRQGRIAEAEEQFRRTLELRISVIGDAHPQTGVTKNNLASLLASQGQFEEASVLAREAAETLRAALGAAHPLTLRSTQTLGSLLAEQGRLEEARPYLVASYEGLLNSVGERHPDALQAGLALARLEVSQGHLDEGQRRLMSALDIAESLRTEVIGAAQARAAFAGALRLADIATDCAMVLIKLERPTDALTVLERGQSRAGLDLMLGGTVAADRGFRAGAELEALARYETLIAAEQEAEAAVFEVEARRKAARSATDRGEWEERLKNARVILSERTAAVFDELRTLVPVGSPLDASQIVSTLRENQALLCYAWSENVVIAVVATQHDVRGFVLADTKNQVALLNARASDLRASISERTGVSLASLIRAARDSLIPPDLAATLGDVESVTVIADGPLSGVPFELLIDDRPIANAPSATVALDRQEASQTRAERLPSAIVLGDPAFSQAIASTGSESAIDATALEQIYLYGDTLTPLPATRPEVEAVARLFGPQCRVLLGSDATARRLRDEVQDAPPRVLHLATHGLMGNSDRPLLASLALASPGTPTRDDNGFLTMDELLSTWGASLENTELVVLSACDTARGIQRGDTTMTLPLAFFVCGAETVIASLWQVDDTATALLMTRFYANWLGQTESVRTIDGVTFERGEPLTKLAALREAQQWLRTRTVDEIEALTGATAEEIASAASRGVGRAAPDSREVDACPYAHPYYWAAFVLYGSTE